MSRNLWPDFDIGQGPRSPKSVIEEAGSGIDQKTRGLITFYSAAPIINGDKVVAEFNLYSSSLRYHFPFLRAAFGVDSVYPVTLTAHKMADIVANDEKELIEALAKIFNASSTVEIVQRLMSLAKS